MKNIQNTESNMIQNDLKSSLVGAISYIFIHDT